MIPGTLNLTLYRGDWYGWRVQLWGDNGLTIPYDLTGHTVAAQVRATPGGAPAVDLEAVVVPPNRIDLAVTPDLWDAMPAAGAWDLQVTDPAGHPMTPLAGSVATIADVTEVAP